MILWIIYVVFIHPILDIPYKSSIRALCMNIWSCTCCYTYCYVATYWVIKQYKKQLNQFDKNREGIQMKLLDILSSKDGFDLFASHLVNEFSLENLAFIFEVMEIKRECANHRFAYYILQF